MTGSDYTTPALTAATRLRLSLRAAARDPLPPHRARTNHGAEVSDAHDELLRYLTRWPPRPGRRWRTATRLWASTALNLFYYRLIDYTRVEQEAWAALTAASPPTAATLRRLVDLRNDAQRRTASSLGGTLTEQLERGSAANPAPWSRRRRHRPAESPPAAAPQPDPQSLWPIIDQPELARRVAADLEALTTTTTAATPSTSTTGAPNLDAPAAVDPWLRQLLHTLSGPVLSPPALQLACQQWRHRRRPWFNDDADLTRGHCRISGHPPL